MNALLEQPIIAEPSIFVENKSPVYVIERMTNGFKIQRENLIQAEITLLDGIQISIKFIDLKDNTKSLSVNLGLMNYRELKRILAEEVLKNWKKKQIEQNRTKAFKLPKNHKFNSMISFIPKKLGVWASVQLNKGLTSPLYPEWQRLLTLVDPVKFSILKKFFVVRGPKAKMPAFLTNKNIYENKNLVNDLLSYNSIYFCLENAKLTNEIPYFCITNNAGNNANYDYTILKRKTETNWRLLFSDIPSTYKALNKTLDSCPRGIPSEILFNLRYAHLKEPITDRVKLLVFCSAAGNPRYRIHLDCIMRSSPEQIRRAFYSYKKSRRVVDKKFNLRRFGSILDFVNYVCDYDQVHDGEIVGLLEKSRTWHQNRTYNYAVKGLDPKQKTKVPPIPLPEEKGISFLSTVKDVADEGKNMNHCIASYIRSAVNGDCYLFHCEKDKEHASVSISPNGEVDQSYGPYNSKNKASEWGAAVLGKWGKKFFEKVENE